MNKAFTRFFLRKNPNGSDGKRYITLYANINGQKKVYGLGLTIDVKHWDRSQGKAKNLCPDFNLINSKITHIQSFINNTIVKAEIENRKISQFDIAEVFNNKFKTNDLVEFMQMDLKDFAKRYSKETLRTYKSQLTKLRQFSKKVCFEEINPVWWHQYHKFLVDRGNNATTIHKTFRHLNVFINKAVELEIIPSNKIRKVKIRAGKTNRKYLLIDELKKLNEYYKNEAPLRHRSVLKYFLFACYTGLRYTDIKLLCWQNIKEHVIDIQFHKTGKAEHIPLSKSAKELLPVRGSSARDSRVFKTYSNQKTNDYLEECMIATGIEKHITFHCARHTFATISLKLSGDIATVSKLLGHSRISTTEIYAKVLDESKTALIERWNLV